MFGRHSKQLSRIQDFQKYRSMSTTEGTIPLIERAKRIVPSLSDGRHKGQAGRIGIFGGSLEYTGAPYFAAISALRTGADLVHVFCQQAAAPVIKSYSPELIVHPLLDQPKALIQIEPWLERLHVCVIGPGLGRDRAVLQTVADLIRTCRQLQKPLVIDADGLFLITQDASLIKDYNNVILTPNAIEFSRLFGNDRALIPTTMEKVGRGVTIIEKGLNDRIYDTATYEKFECPSGGSGRRCGGQGDLLAGAIATFFCWALDTPEEESPATVACFAASYLVKACNQHGFAIHGRSMVASDMVQEIHRVFEEYFERK